MYNQVPDHVINSKSQYGENFRGVLCVPMDITGEMARTPLRRSGILSQSVEFRKEVPGLKFCRLIAIYIPSLRVVIIHLKTRHIPLSPFLKGPIL